MNRRKKVKRLGAKTISFPKGKGHLTHNNREFISNNVVPERTVWNRIYIQESLEQAYEKCFGQALRDYNVAQKRKDRRKENYLKEIENSGNKEKTFYENIVQIGKKDDTPVVGADGKLTEEAKAAIEILEQYAKTFQERNPNLYLFNCVMHLDEATPHLHIDYIPVANGYKTGMKTRNSLTKALQQMGFAKAVSKKENETVAWQQRERTYLTELCQEKGIDVEVLGVQRDNLTLPEYKAAMQKVEALEQQAEEMEMDKLFFAVYGVLICLGIIFITALQYTGLNQNGMITVCMVGAGILSITSISVIDKLFFGKMAELGESCYFNTKQCVAAWLVLSGMINVMILFLIAGYLNYHWRVGLLQVGLYILTPYLVSSITALGILSMETRGKNSSLFGMSAILLSISYGVIGSIPRALFVTTLWIWAVAFLVSGLLFVMQIKKLLSKMEKGEVLCTN